jgi:phosphotransferase system enzyme I (PtsI)
VMLPLVTTIAEIREVRALIAREAEMLKAGGHEVQTDFPLGIMIEVPAAALAADVLAVEADFFSIGTNDLIQFALAVDRGSESMADLYQPAHAGVLRMLQSVVRGARSQGIPVAVCGEMAADPQLVQLLVGLGLRELSVQPRAIGRVRDAVRMLDVEQAKGLLAEALEVPVGSKLDHRLR